MRRTRQSGEGDLSQIHRFRGHLRHGGDELPVRFSTRIRPDGEIALDLHAFRITKASRFVREAWRADRNEITEFHLEGRDDGGLEFRTESLTFSKLGERWSGRHDRHWSKPVGEIGGAVFSRTLPAPAALPLLKLHLKGFECYPALHATCPLGTIVIKGATSVSEYNNLSGLIQIQAPAGTEDAEAWRGQVEPLLDHIRRLLSIGASTMLLAPVTEFVNGNSYEAICRSQSQQNPSLMRAVHKLALQPLLDTAIAHHFGPKIVAHNLDFAVEWLTMTSVYNEVRLVSAMTALENLIDANLSEDEALIEPAPEYKKTYRLLRQTIKAGLTRWSPDRAERAREELGEKLLDLNRRPLRRKLMLLADRWRVPLGDIDEAAIVAAIKARNAIVHRGYHDELEGELDLWDHMTLVRELALRFLFTAIGYSGPYVTHLGGYRQTDFPPPRARSEG